MKELDILCVEDNEDYCFFLGRALKNSSISMKYEIIKEGDKAVEVLQEKSEEYIKPKMIFLDINLHGMDGLEILKSIKESNRLKYIPVIMLSTSDNPKDISQAFSLGANAYVSKPSSFNKLKDFVEECCNFWLKYNHTSLSTTVYD